MQLRIFRGTDLHTVLGAKYEVGVGGKLTFEPGNFGFVAYGPYASVEDGVYRVKVHAHVEVQAGKTSYFEIFDPALDHRVYAFREYERDFEVYVRLYKSDHLEFRFRCDGEAITIDCIEIEAVLFDAERADLDTLRSVFDRLVAAAAEPEAVHRVIDRIGAWGASAEAEDLRIAYVPSRTSPEVKAWAYILSLNSAPPRPLEAAGGAEIPSDLSILIERQPLRLLEAFHMTLEMRNAIRPLGYEPDHLKATYLHRDYQEAARLWHDRPEDGASPKIYPARQPLFERYVDIDRSYQTSLALARGIAAYCPVSGDILRSLHGFLVIYADLPFIFYRFEGMEVFYLCVGHMSNIRLFIYTPRSQSIFWISDPHYRNYDPLQLVKLLNIQLIKHSLKVITYINNSTSPAAVVGHNIYGHFFWTSLSGLQFAFSAGLFIALKGLVKVPRQFVAPEAIFSELGALKISTCTTVDTAFLECVENAYVPICFSDVAMDRALVKRLRDFAEAHKSQDNARETELTPSFKLTRPLIWINLRAHSKIWVSQTEGYANILNELYLEYEGVSVFLDGLPDCAQLATDLRKMTRPEIPIFDGLGLNFADTLSWALKVDAYISCISSGLLVVDVIAERPGVAHSEHAHLSQMDWWHTILPGNTAPLHPRQDQIDDLGGGLYGNYEVDWKVLLDLLRQVLRDHFVATSVGA